MRNVEKEWNWGGGGGEGPFNRHSSQFTQQYMAGEYS